MLQESRHGRYEAHRSLCIRFLSHDHRCDDVIWSRVVMRVAFRSDATLATIVCWNHVIDQQEALDLRQRTDELESADVMDAMDSNSGPPRPSTVVEIEEEGLSHRGNGTDRRSSQRSGLNAIRGVSHTVRRASSKSFSSGSDEFPSSRTGSTQDEDEILSEVFVSDHIHCAASRNLAFGSVGCGETGKLDSVHEPGGEVSRDFMSDVIRCATSQGSPFGSGNTPTGFRDRHEEPTGLQPRSDTARRRSFGNLSPLSARSSDAELSDVFHGTVSRIFAHGDCQENTHVAGKRRGSEDSSLADDITNKASRSPVVPPAAVGAGPMVGNTFPSFSETFLTIPSPPIDRQRCADPWRHCTILSWFNRSGFNPFDVQTVSADRITPSDDRCLSEMQSLRAAVSDRSAWSETSAEQQRAANYYELPVLDAQEVDAVLE